MTIKLVEYGGIDCDLHLRMVAFLSIDFMISGFSLTRVIVGSTFSMKYEQ